MNTHFHLKPVTAGSGDGSQAGVCDLLLAIHYF